jgi:hypothetical protein
MGITMDMKTRKWQLLSLIKIEGENSLIKLPIHQMNIQAVNSSISSSSNYPQTKYSPNEMLCLRL